MPIASASAAFRMRAGTMFRRCSLSPPNIEITLTSRSFGVVPKPPVSSAMTATSSSTLVLIPVSTVRA